MTNNFSNHSAEKKAGVYIHIPFCRSRCSYCDFATDVYKNAEIVESYVDALVKEVSGCRLQVAGFRSEVEEELEIPNSKSEIEVDTIYFGGGTPSLLAPQQLERILKIVHEKFSVDKSAEITMEMNPATVSLETLREYRNLGVNRASFGAQTFDDAELKRLGRKHTADDVRETIELLRRADFENVSFDLIAGLPRQTVEDWKRNLSEALKLNPEHLSLYLLEIHQSTPLAEQIRSGRQPLPDENTAAEMYEILLEEISRNGYEQYEISNFARSGFESKHNSKYWTLDAVYGFGCSAHSFDGVDFRYSNERDTAKYVALIENENSAIVQREKIDVASEFVFLGLRLTKGIDLREYEKQFGKDLIEEYREDLNLLDEFGLIEFDEDYLKLTEKGFLFSNEVFTVFV